MGLFDKKKCDICGKEKGPLFTFKLEGGIVCDECHDKLSKKKFLKGYSLDDAKKELENISEEKEKLKAVVAEKKEKLSNEPITRYCTKCGQKFSGNFCPNCGTPVNNTATNNVTPAYSHRTQPQPSWFFTSNNVSPRIIAYRHTQLRTFYFHINGG